MCCVVCAVAFVQINALAMCDAMRAKMHECYGQLNCACYSCVCERESARPSRVHDNFLFLNAKYH